MNMKRIALFLAIAASFAAVSTAAEQAPLRDQKQKDSYSLGYSFGRNVAVQEVEIDRAVLLAAVEDALNNKKPALSPNEIDDTMHALRRKVRVQQEQHARELAAKNLEQANAFLAANGKKEGVITLPSGLQYKVIREGAGTGPQKTDGVRIRYRGTLADGTEFDNTANTPDSEVPMIPVAGANKGWSEALQLMKPGAKWQLFVPPHLGFGDRQVGRVPANSALIYEMELLSVVDRTAANDPATPQEKKD